MSPYPTQTTYRRI